MLKAISLFTGIGGLDFGFEAAGFATRVAVEMDPVCCRTIRLNRRWPIIEGDIRLHDIVADTLGTSLREALAIRFDLRLAESTLQFYDLREIPAIRDAPPAGVTDIHFRSDLSGVPIAAVDRLIERDPAISHFLPA